MNIFCAPVACKCTFQPAAGANISHWCRALYLEGFAENPNCSLQFPAKAEENGCEFPCPGGMCAFHKSRDLCWDNSSQRQAQPSADRSSGQQISVLNPWRVPCVMPAGKLQLALSETQRVDGGRPCDGLQAWIAWDGMAICNLLTKFVLPKNMMIIITALFKDKGKSQHWDWWDL